MTELKDSVEYELPTEEEYYEQLELNYQIHILKYNKQKFKKKLDKLAKISKRNPNEDYTRDFEVLKAIAIEINEKYKNILSKIKKEYNFFNLIEENENLKEYSQNLKRSLKKGIIDVNTYRITKSHYKARKSEVSTNLRRLNILAESYITLLTNQRLELDAERRSILGSRAKKSENINDCERIPELISKNINTLIDKISYFKMLIKQ